MEGPAVLLLLVAGWGESLVLIAPMATFLSDDGFRSGAGQLDGTLVGTVDVSGRHELVELEKIIGGGGNVGGSSSKLVQRKNGLIGSQPARSCLVSRQKSCGDEVVGSPPLGRAQPGGH